MRTIFIVSPDYLEAIFTESEKYSFCLHGYGNFTNAYRNLKYTNSDDLMGICYVCKQPAEPGSSEYAAFEKFALLANHMHGSKKFLIVTLDSQVNLGSLPKRCDNLRFVHYCEHDAITDITINKNVFGSILLDVSEPYKLKEEKPIDIFEYRCNTLKFIPVVPQEYLIVFEPIYCQQTVKDTVTTDVVVNRSSGVIRQLRIIAILRKMGADSTEFIEKALESFQEMEPKNYGIMLAILKLIEVGAK